MVDYEMRLEPGTFRRIPGSTEMKYYKRLRLEHPAHAKIGKVVTDATMIELQLHLLCIKLGNTPGGKDKYTDHLDAIKKECRGRGLGDIVTEIQQLRMYLEKEVFERRNRLVHDPWYLLDGPEEPCVHTLKRDYEPGVPKLDEALTLLNEASLRVGALANKIEKSIRRP